jgi:hypothetical protein
MKRAGMIKPLAKLGRNINGGRQVRFSQSPKYKLASITFHVSDPDLVAWARVRIHELDPPTPWRSQRSKNPRYDLNTAKIITPPWPAWMSNTSILRDP